MASEELTDWRTGMSFQERLLFMYSGQYACDVTLSVGRRGGEELVSAHRFILILSSPVFDAMLQSWPSQSEPLIIEDVEADVFKQMIKFLYCERVDINGGSVYSLLGVAMRFMVSPLIEKCLTYLRQNMTVKSVCTTLNVSLKLEEPCLIAECMGFIKKNAHAILTSDGLMALEHASLLKIVQCDDLEADEVAIYLAVVDWAGYQCKKERKEVDNNNLRASLGEILFNVRFTTMSPEEFSQITHKNALLTPLERLYVHDVLVMKSGAPDAGDYGCAKFNTKPRKIQSTKRCYLTINRFEKVEAETDWSYTSGLPDEIVFTTKKNLKLAGVGLYGGKQPSTHKVRVKVVDKERFVLADTLEFSMRSSGSSDPQPVMFASPVIIEANKLYFIEAYISGPPTFRGECGHNTCEKHSLSVTFKSNLYNNGTTVSYGQIPSLYIAR